MYTNKVLAVKMGDNDAEAETVGDYLKELLQCVWHDGEGFSGKRPFGNSGWEHEIYQALASEGYIISESIDGEEHLEIDSSEQEKANQLIRSAIKSLS